ncbi:alpha/beta fold hydrolase [Aspergillus homomorphus CBS 101889]|uniref:AB hydrolase-1 domain-containing protein n=1 Tax=Aspergillus homomorphus (strain CBS 101889) TaxID=1450537 RepID=A0A395HPZ8_ASPHC|nr:hypothetical protein BO97DRAFT_480000 [Aspergillus homomorphus CBS 101889]RAL09345.1 hypothetical protein BO97DRAFT_480000 [Aspergillus homomorphus CBS 101889]
MSSHTIARQTPPNGFRDTRLRKTPTDGGGDLSADIRADPARPQTRYPVAPRLRPCKEELHDLVFQRSLKDHTFIAYDAPGCAATMAADPTKATIAFMVATAEAVLQHYRIDRLHLIGHSMGGLTALILADKYPDRIISFVDIKGNLAPEDCFLSRQIFTHLGFRLGGIPRALHQAHP